MYAAVCLVMLAATARVANLRNAAGQVNVCTSWSCQISSAKQPAYNAATYVGMQPYSVCMTVLPPNSFRCNPQHQQCMQQQERPLSTTNSAASKNATHTIEPETAEVDGG
jgi:hypothetical protein